MLETVADRFYNLCGLMGRVLEADAGGSTSISLQFGSKLPVFDGLVRRHTPMHTNKPARRETPSNNMMMLLFVTEPHLTVLGSGWFRCPWPEYSPKGVEGPYQNAEDAMRPCRSRTLAFSGL